MSGDPFIVCSNGNCQPVDGATAFLIIATMLIGDELEKGDKAFGKNSEVAKLFRTVFGDLKAALRDGKLPANNDLRKFFENAWSDVTKGLGPNNDLRKALESLGIRL